MYYFIKNTLSGKPQLLKQEEDFTQVVDELSDWYKSLYLFDEGQADRILSTGSIAGLKEAVTDTIYFDFDSKTNVAVAKEDVKRFLGYLEQNNIRPENYRIFFSGKKGFGVELKLDQLVTNKQVRNILYNLATSYPTLDVVVADAARIIRVPNTKHQETGLFKIPLSVKELRELDVDDIRDLARSPRRGGRTLVAASLPPSLLEITTEREASVRVANKPRHWRSCKWQILQGNFKAGERHNALMVLAATCLGMGYDKETAYYMLKSAIKKQAKASGQEEFPTDEVWENILETVYGASWEGGSYSCKENSWLKLYCEGLGKLGCKHNEQGAGEVKTFLDIQSSFKEYVETVDKNIIKIGVPSLDKELFLAPGVNMGILGAPASGKSAMALNILNNTSKQGVKSVFASLDMHPNRMFEKMIYKVSRKKREEIYQLFKNNQEAELIEQVKREFSNVYFFNKSAPTVGDLKKYILNVEETTGEKVRLVVVDYFERVFSDFSDENQSAKRVAGELQDLVNELNIALITLVQPNKSGLDNGGCDKPILSYNIIKGSSYIPQSFRVIISLWRPFATPELSEYDKYMNVAILKNDLGELNTHVLSWDGPTGHIRDITEPEMISYRLACDQKQALQNASKKDNDDSW